MLFNFFPPEVGGMLLDFLQVRAINGPDRMSGRNFPTGAAKRIDTLSSPTFPLVDLCFPGTKIAKKPTSPLMFNISNAILLLVWFIVYSV